MNEAQQLAVNRPRYRRVVVKFGTNLLTAGTDRLDLEVMAGLTSQIARAMIGGARIAVVTSGAIAAGRHRLGTSGRGRDVVFRQMLAAVGQPYLMHSYEQLFAWHDIRIAQVLLTKKDIHDREGYLNVRNTLLAMLDAHVVPIINENDVISLDEVAEAKIGENDNLAALVANLIDADLLLILTNTDGLYTADPTVDPTARHIPHVERIDESIMAMAGGARSTRARGGMRTKLAAAALATASGSDVVVANGHTAGVLDTLLDGGAIGTLFTASADRLESRKRWMRSGLSSRGRIIVDAGAARALTRHDRSLLPAGVVRAEGVFSRGDVVALCDEQEHVIAYGISNYDNSDVNSVRGLNSDTIVEKLGHTYGEEIVHRSNLVLI